MRGGEMSCPEELFNLTQLADVSLLEARLQEYRLKQQKQIELNKTYVQNPTCQNLTQPFQEDVRPPKKKKPYQKPLKSNDLMYNDPFSWQHHKHIKEYEPYSCGNVMKNCEKLCGERKFEENNGKNIKFVVSPNIQTKQLENLPQNSRKPRMKIDVSKKPHALKNRSDEEPEVQKSTNLHGQSQEYQIQRTSWSDLLKRNLNLRGHEKISQQENFAKLKPVELHRQLDLKGNDQPRNYHTDNVQNNIPVMKTQLECIRTSQMNQCQQTDVNQKQILHNEKRKKDTVNKNTQKQDDSSSQSSFESDMEFNKELTERVAPESEDFETINSYDSHISQMFDHIVKDQHQCLDDQSKDKPMRIEKEPEENAPSKRSRHQHKARYEHKLFDRVPRARVLQCSDCGQRYSTPSNLERHRQTHAGVSALKSCRLCGKAYASAPALAMHVQTHTRECECRFCGKRFSRPWLLQGHIRTHTGEKPFHCSVCSKAFADKSNLRAHVQTHSMTKPHVCLRCGKAFALKSYLYKHEEVSCLKTSAAGRAAIQQSKNISLQDQNSSTIKSETKVNNTLQNLDNSRSGKSKPLIGIKNKNISSMTNSLNDNAIEFDVIVFKDSINVKHEGNFIDSRIESLSSKALSLKRKFYDSSTSENSESWSSIDEQVIPVDFSNAACGSTQSSAIAV